MSDKIISVENLYKRYVDVVAVDGISFDAFRGEILGILGPNGSGKTTTLKSILGLIYFDSGSVLVNGMDIRKDRKKILSDVGAVLEGARNIYWHLSAEENLVYFAGIKGFSKRDIAERMEVLLSGLELEDVRSKEVRQFSKGMKQKVALACAFVHDPGLLLLDEPTLGLDVEISLAIRGWLRSSVREEGKTILVTSHNMDFIESICDRVLIIKDGKIVSHETVDSLKDKFSQKVYELEIEGKLSALQEQKIGEIGQLEWEECGENTRLHIQLENAMLVYDLVEVLRSEGTVLRNFRTKESDLEDIFLTVIREDRPDEDL